MDWVNAVVQGALLGGLYALFAAGLSLMFGIMRLINIAHGDLIVLAAYLALLAVRFLGLDPFLCLLVVTPLMFAFGYGLQRGLLNATLGPDILPPLLVTFGLSIMIQNGLLEAFSADSHRLQAGAIETASLHLGGGLAVGWFPLLVFAAAILIIGALEALLYHTRLGRAFRAVSDDLDTAQLFGVAHHHVFALATALALGVVAVAGIFLAIHTNFDPTVGPARLLYAFEAVIIGGLGSLWGTLAGGVILGIAQSVGAQVNPGLEILAGHLAFLAVLVIKPRGIFPRREG